MGPGTRRLEPGRDDLEGHPGWGSRRPPQREHLPREEGGLDFTVTRPALAEPPEEPALAKAAASPARKACGVGAAVGEPLGHPLGPRRV